MSREQELDAAREETLLGPPDDGWTVPSGD